jgi:hypothetical protein
VSNGIRGNPVSSGNPGVAVVAGAVLTVRTAPIVKTGLSVRNGLTAPTVPNGLIAKIGQRLPLPKRRAASKNGP